MTPNSVAEAFQSGNQQNPKDFHHWRCHTASFLATLPSEADIRAHAELVVQTLEHTLWYTLTGGGTSSKSKKSRGGGGGKVGNLNLRSGLLEIVISAIHFDKELCQQRAFWYCEYPASSSASATANSNTSCSGIGTGSSNLTRFDPHHMEALNGDSKSVGQGAVVTLMVSPMLVKAGDSYGKGYDMPESIEKSVVHVVSKFWEDNGYSQPSPSPSPSFAPTSSRGRDMGMVTQHPEATPSAMVVYTASKAPSSRSSRSRYSRPATGKTREGKKGKGKIWRSLGGLKGRTALGDPRSDFRDGS